VWLIVTLVCSILEFLISGAGSSLFIQYKFAVGVTHALFFSYAVIVVLSFMEQLKIEHQTTLPAFEAVESVPGDDDYGQPSQSPSVGQQEPPPPPSYDRPSKAIV